MSGSGKTFSALRIATGNPARDRRRVCVIDIERLHYADDFRFMHMQFDARSDLCAIWSNQGGICGRRATIVVTA